jgi:hypothetical protein
MRKGTKRAAALARDGQIVSKFFNTYGSRPQPTNRLSLEQSIQMELTITSQNIVNSSATYGLPTFAAVATTLSQFAGATSLLAVFDQYRIDQIEHWVEYTNPSAVINFPTLISAVDLDDANVPSAVGQVQDHQGSVVGVAPAGHYHRFKPHMATAAFSGAFTSYSNTVAGWVDSASPNVQHYGLKLATISNGSASSANLTTRIVVSFRAPAIN